MAAQHVNREKKKSNIIIRIINIIIFAVRKKCINFPCIEKLIHMDIIDESLSSLSSPSTSVNQEVDIIYSFEELVKYQEKINDCAATDSSSLVFNDSVVHASLIMQCFFTHAISSLNMYCGEFSIFREAFKNKLTNMFQKDKYNSVRESQDFKEFNPYKKSLDALVDFLKRGGKMNVITDDDITSMQNEPVWSFIKVYVESGALRFYRRNDSFLKGTFHFTVADAKMYRTENDRESRTAICCFYDLIDCKMLNTFFSIIKEKAIPVKFN